MIRLSTLILISLFAATAGAETVSIGLECSVSSGPGQSKIEILQTSQFTVHYPKAIKTIYSCGPFVNDGSVDQTNATIVEIASDSCAHYVYGGYTQIIYCF